MTAALALAATSCHPPTDRLAGDYHSTWGGCQVAVRGRDAVVHYPHGVMSCQIESAETAPPQHTLRCGWQSDDARGRASFRVEPDGHWQGTWGHGERDDDGGAWVLTR